MRRHAAVDEFTDGLFADRRPPVAAFAQLTDALTITDQFVALAAFVGRHAIGRSVGNGQLTVRQSVQLRAPLVDASGLGARPLAGGCARKSAKVRGELRTFSMIHRS